MPQLLTADSGRASEFGANWRLQFLDADGNTLTMQSFSAVDFGAISYKEIFQNVKTILTTPLHSAALERTLGLDTTIVDLPIDRAAEATVAIIDALYFWEPRAEVVDIEFGGDALSGHLQVNLQLRVRNVIYGTTTPYDKTTIHEAEPIVPPALPPSEVPPIGPIPGPPGAPGITGQRGSLWFTGTSDPPTPEMEGADVRSQDMFLNTASGDIFQFDGVTATWRRA